MSKDVGMSEIDPLSQDRSVPGFAIIVSQKTGFAAEQAAEKVEDIARRYSDSFAAEQAAEKSSS